MNIKECFFWRLHGELSAHGSIGMVSTLFDARSSRGRVEQHMIFFGVLFGQGSLL